MNGNRKVVAVVTEGAAQAVLRRGAARELSAEEDRVMRMRLGAAPPRAEPLERVGVRTDAEIELLAYEIEAWLRLRDRGAPSSRPEAAADSAKKAKIVRALRRKR